MEWLNFTAIASLNPENLTIHHVIHVPKLALPLLQTLLIQFVVPTKYRTLHYHNITYGCTNRDVRTLQCVLSVASLWHQI